MKEPIRRKVTYLLRIDTTPTRLQTSGQTATKDWKQAQTWTVLDADFGNGTHFLELIASWRSEQQLPAILHYVGLVETPALTAPLQKLLRTQRGTLENGFQRFLLEGGRVSVTLCLGDNDSMLKALRMQADTVVGPRAPHLWTRWNWKALAKQCRLRCTLTLPMPLEERTAATLREAGFVPDTEHRSIWQYVPPWKLRHPLRTQQHGPSPKELHCAIIGAGLAGASVAHLLALRGWRVTVLDGHSHAAEGASGLPMGLAVPHVSSDDSPRSRLSRAGIALLYQHAQCMLTIGEDWSPTGVLELQPGKGIWHAKACWMRPARLVNAWLGHPNICFQGGYRVAALKSDNGVWSLQDTKGNTLTQADHVVLANAHAVCNLELPKQLDPNTFRGLQSIRGVMSIGAYPAVSGREVDALPFPVNGDGSFIPAVPGSQGVQWHCGATFERNSDPSGEITRGHYANQMRLQKLLPDVAASLQHQWESPELQSWAGERCATLDRLPLVGALASSDAGAVPGLWCSIGMGSRGLSFAALCAEILVAEMLDEPMPLESGLLKCVRANRKRPITPS